MGDLTGKTVLITGASSGIGLEAAVALAGRGARVALVARDRRRGERALEAVRRRASPDVSLFLCDVGSRSDLRRLAEEVRATHDRLDVLVNNAGAVNACRRVTADGLELTFAVNHLGYFLLTHLLLDLLRASAPARVVNVASAAHRQADLDFDDLQYERGYGLRRAYARSKLANVLFSSELARRLADSGVTSNALHPGTVATNIWSGAPWFARPLLAVAKRLVMITVAQGAERIVHLAAGPEVEGQTGGYYEDGRLVRPSRLARDEALAARLWDVSEKLVGLR
jgi:NAD(P)-dependent dehydrogenase (short-subunit alcohol dehydrogenase family)